MKKGFTLIELLAVLIVLAIIALIAVPIVLNVIKDSKEKSAKISVQNYLKAVEVAVMNKDLDIETKNLDGEYDIINNGKQIQSSNNTINIEYNGEGLTSGRIKIENLKITEIKKGRIDNWDIDWKEGEALKLKQHKEEIKVTLLAGTNFNVKIKQLANPDKQISSHATADTTVTSIEFYSNEELPSDYTLSDLKELNSVDVSSKGDGSIIAYYDNINNKVYVYSDNLISFNEKSNNMFYYFKALTEIKFGIIDTSNTTNMVSMFLYCTALKKLDLSSFDTSNVVDKGLQQLFRECNSLETVDLSSFNTSKAKDMSFMFYGCKALKSIDLSNFDTSNVTTMSYMFYQCNALETLDLSNFNTSNVESMQLMFGSCKKLKTLDLSSFNTSKVKDSGMQQMFSYCTGLESIKFGKNFRTDNIKSMQAMFISCEKLKKLDLRSFNTSNVTNMKNTFSNCYALESIKFGENFNTSSVTDMESMFYYCKALTKLDLRNFDTSSVTDMTSMFSKTTKLKPIFIGEGWVIGESTTTTNMFYESLTKDVSQLCEPNSTEEWCVLTS